MSVYKNLKIVTLINLPTAKDTSKASVEIEMSYSQNFATNQMHCLTVFQPNDWSTE